MSAPNPSPKRTRSVLLGVFLFLGALVCVALLLGFVALILGREMVDEIGRTARAARPFAALVWAGAIFLAVRYHWETIVDWLIARAAVAPQARTALLSARWRIATLFWVIDATVVAGFPFWMR